MARLEFCERCQHTHKVDGPCVTECWDSEADVVAGAERHLAEAEARGEI